MGDLIKTIVYDEVYRSLCLCSISIFLSFALRNTSIKVKAASFAVFNIPLIAFISLIIFLSWEFNNHEKDALTLPALWGLKWLCYFNVIMFIQYVVASRLRKMNKVIIISAVTLIGGVSMYFMLKYMLQQQKCCKASVRYVFLALIMSHRNKPDIFTYILHAILV